MTKPIPTTAVDIARAVKAGEVSARTVLEEHLVRVSGHDGTIRAFNCLMTEAAVEAADAVDAAVKAGDVEHLGPLAGVPVALKDNLCTRGVETTCSSKILKGWKPPYDATVVQRLAAAGALPVGKTNLDEFAMGSSTEHSAFGPTRNPRDTSRVPGGSSGGSAAAVAAGFAPVALGSDTGGSIRQPAAFCGVVGMKPTYGAVSRYGLIAFASSLDQIGPFTATVADSALVFQVISGHDPADSTSLPESGPDCMSALSKGVDGLKIGVIKELSSGEGFEQGVLDRFSEASAALEEGGATVEEVSVPNTIHGLSAYYLIAPSEASSNLSRYDGVRYGYRWGGANDITEMYCRTRAEGFGPEVKRRIMLGTFALSAGYYDAYYAQAQRLRTLTIDDFARAYAEYDVLITPTTPTTAFEFGGRADPLSMYLCDVCTIPTNLAGDPAMSVPFGTGAADMPVGIQVLAPGKREDLMFQVAAELERRAPSLSKKGATK